MPLQTVEELQKTEIVKKSREITEELGKTAGKAADTLSKSSQQISQTAAFKSVSQVSVIYNSQQIAQLIKVKE